MIDYSKLIDFLNDNDLNNEELLLLYSLYMKHEQLLPEKHKDIEKYYMRNSGRGVAFTKMVKELEEKGLLSRLRETEPILIKDLEISEKFTDLLFIQPDDIFSRFYAMYPSKGVSPDGYSYFTANLLDKDDKDYFTKNILKNVNKQEADRILYVVSEMFDVGYDNKPKNFAKVGISKFIRNLPEIIKQWEEEQQENSGNWNTTRL